MSDSLLVWSTFVTFQPFVVTSICLCTCCVCCAVSFCVCLSFSVSLYTCSPLVLWSCLASKYRATTEHPLLIKQACSSAAACRFAAPPSFKVFIWLLNIFTFVFVCFSPILGAEETKTDSPAIQNGGEEEKQTTEELEKGMKALSTNDTSTPAAPPAKPQGGTPEGSPSKSPSKKKKKFKPPSFLKKSKKQKEKAETWDVWSRVAEPRWNTTVKYFLVYDGVAGGVDHIRCI